MPYLNMPYLNMTTHPIKLFVTIYVLLLSGCNSSSPTTISNYELMAKKGSGELLIVRGYNGGSPCNAAVIGNGNSPSVGPKELLTNLSISCGDSKKVTYADLRAPLPSTHACVTYLRKLNDQNQDTQVVKDPIDGNRYHCLLSEITPKQFISGSKWQD